jgi:hypothetical protein
VPRVQKKGRLEAGPDHRIRASYSDARFAAELELVL